MFIIKDRFKALGLVLIVIGMTILVATSGFCIVGWYVRSCRYCRIKVQAKASDGVDEMTI